MAKQKKEKELTPDDYLKLEIAQEIGVLDKVLTGGWRSLSAQESGRIGGIMTSRKKKASQSEFPG